MDEKPKKKAKNRARNLAIDIATLFVIGVVAVVAIVLLGQGEGGTQGPGENLVVSNVYCSKSDVENPFVKNKPESGLHEVRANFQNDKLVDIMYSFTATYPNNVDLSQAKTRIHADFDLAYGNAYVHRDDVWSEGFSTDNDKHQVKMNIYSKSDYVKSSVAEVFLLDSSQSFPQTMSAMRSAYQAAGFSCQASK